MPTDAVKKLVGNLRRMGDIVGRRHVSAIAASGAFWFFLSLVPTVILAASLLPYSSVSRTALLDALRGFLPDSLSALLERIVADVYGSSPAVTSLSLLTTVWSSACGFSTLIRGLEEVCGQPRRAGYLLRRLRGVLCTLCLLAALLLAAALMGLGRNLRELAERLWPPAEDLFLFLVRFRFLPVIAVLALLFALIYQWAPGLPLSFSTQFPGALLAALGWSLFSRAFSAWVSFTGAYGTYGSLANVAAVMLWMYYCMYILLLGACLNLALRPLGKE